MAVALPPRSPTAPPPGRVSVALGRPRPRPEGRQPNCTAAWTLVAVLLAFKIVTITLVFMAAYPSENLVAMLLAMNWPWLIVLGLLLSVIPAGYWYRLIRLRARRKQLQRSEWNVS